MSVINEILMGVLNSLHYITGSYGWSIILFAVIIKILLYYPTQSQYKAMKDMQAIQPEVKKLQEKYKGDPQKMNMELMLLYKQHKVNPLGGCLPILIQMPILWGIWTTINAYKDNFGKSAFLWIGTALASRYPEIFSGSLANPDLPLLLFYGFSMYLSQKMTVVDPATAGTQKMMNLVMPVFFTYMMYMWKIPSALILYWLVFNILSIIQQVMILKESTTPLSATVTEAKVAIPAPKARKGGKRK